jgi:hypothetical protein
VSSTNLHWENCISFLGFGVMKGFDYNNMLQYIGCDRSNNMSFIMVMGNAA